MTYKLWLISAPNDDCNLSDEYSNIRHYFTPTFTDETDYGTFQVINLLLQSPAKIPPSNSNIYLLLPFPNISYYCLSQIQPNTAFPKNDGSVVEELPYYGKFLQTYFGL